MSLEILKFCTLIYSRTRVHLDMTSSTKTRSPLRGRIPSVNSSDNFGESIRTYPYYPEVRVTRREQALHPILVSAQDLDPIPESRELHVRLHPALANAKSSAAPLDTKDMVPLPLFGAPNSRRYPRIVSTSVSKSSSEGSSMYTSPLMTMLIAEVDSEITALSSNSKPIMKKDRPTKRDIPTRPHLHQQDKHEQNQMTLQRTDTIDKELSATSRRMKDMQQRGERKRATAKASISNFKELAATVASARIQTFKASPEYLAYKSDQQAICRDPGRKDIRERVANFEKTPLWQQYVEDVTLVLEQGNIHDLDSITVSNAPSVATTEAPPVPPRLRRKEKECSCNPRGL